MLKGGIKTAHNNSLKRSYKSLSPQEYRIMKKVERKEQADKFLYGGCKGFYKNCPRLENGMVDWDNVLAVDIETVEWANKVIERFNKIDENLISQTVAKFRGSQFSYSQSF